MRHTAQNQGVITPYPSFFLRRRETKESEKRKMNELLNLLYEPTGFNNNLLNISILGLLGGIVIGTIVSHPTRKITKSFLLKWLSYMVIFALCATYSVIMERQERNTLNKNDISIIQHENELIIVGQKPYMKTKTFTIEDESDTNVYIKDGKNYIKLSKKDF